MIENPLYLARVDATHWSVSRMSIHGYSFCYYGLSGSDLSGVNSPDDALKSRMFVDIVSRSTPGGGSGIFKIRCNQFSQRLNLQESRALWRINQNQYQSECPETKHSVVNWAPCFRGIRVERLW